MPVDLGAQPGSAPPLPLTSWWELPTQPEVGVIIVSVVKDITVAARYHFFLHGQSAETLRALLLLRGGPQVLVNSALVSAQVSLCVRLTNAAALGIRKSIS
jgi:hypothetical protein